MVQRFFLSLAHKGKLDVMDVESLKTKVEYFVCLERYWVWYREVFKEAMKKGVWGDVPKKDVGGKWGDLDLWSRWKFVLFIIDSQIGVGHGAISTF